MNRSLSEWFGGKSLDFLRTVLHSLVMQRWLEGGPHRSNVTPAYLHIFIASTVQRCRAFLAKVAVDPPRKVGMLKKSKLAFLHP